MTTALDTPSFHAVDSFVGNRHHADNLGWRACPVCQHPGHRGILRMDDFQLFSDSASQPKRVSVQQVQCEHCFTLFLNPCFRESAFAHLFEEAGMSYGSTALRPAEQRHWLGERGLLQAGAVVLDVGCFEGDFLAALPDTLVRQGVDIDDGAIRRAQRRHPGLQLVASRFETFSVPTAPQLITLFHVLEHVTDPVAVLARLRSVAADGAHLVVEVPVLESGRTNDVNGFFSVAHLTHFSRHSLANTLQVAGWQVIEAQTMPGYNGHRVVAVPAAPRAAEAGHPDDLATVQAILRNWDEAGRDVDRALGALTPSGDTVVWGAGLHTELLYQRSSLFRDPDRRFFLVDSDPLKQGRSWRGLPIRAPGVLHDVDWDHTQVVVSSYQGQDAITEAALARGVPAHQVLRLYQVVHVC